MIYDIAVIGAGVTGSMIARELSMLENSLCIIEARSDVAAGASRANSGIVHAGYDAQPGSLKAKFNAQGNAMMEQTASELGVPYSNCGALVVACDAKDEKSIEELNIRGDKNGVPTKIISPEQIRKIEPMLSDKITSALYAKTAGIVCPFTLTIAATENAVVNGARLFLDSEVKRIKKDGDIYKITAGKNEIKARYIVNAAGVYADEVSKMAGAESFSIHPRRGEYIIFDKEMKAHTSTVIFKAPTPMGKGVLLTPTVYGNMLAGPTAQDIDDKEDKSTTMSGIEEVVAGVKNYLPSIDRRAAITVFAGLRAVSPTHDFIIEKSAIVKNFVNVAGIESPGLTAAPAIAQYVKQMLENMGLSDKKDANATRIRRPIEVFANASNSRKRLLIENNPKYANIVCRCEYVTEAQIVESINRGAKTVDGIKFRVGAGMGRCHGGFCMPRVMGILARELGKEYNEITKSGIGSAILLGKTKEEL